MWIYLACAISALIAIAGLASYLPGLAILGSFGPGYIPMAPSSALCILLAGSVLALRVRWRQRGASPMTLAVPTLFMVLICLLEIAENQTGSDWDFGNWPAVGRTLGGIPVGQMSSATGPVLLSIGLSTFALLLPAKDGRRARLFANCSSALGSISLLVSATFFLAYLYGTPLMYTGTSVPMAAPTSLALLFLCAAMVAQAGTESFLSRLFSGTSTAVRLRRAFIPLSLGIVILTVAIVRSETARKLGNEALVTAITSVVVMVAVAITIGIVARNTGRSLDETNARLVESEDRFSTLFRDSPLPTSLSRLGDGTLVDVNAAWIGLFGYDRRGEVIGKTVMELSFFENPEDRQRLVNSLRDDGQAVTLETRLRKKTGEFVAVAKTAAIVHIGGERYLIIQIQDLTERKEAEGKIQKALGENQTLLHELQHRAKNSFNRILSMTNMASMASGDPDIKDALAGLGLRVEAIAEFYSLLYASGSPTDLRLDEYCERVAGPLVALSKDITLKVEMDRIEMPARKIVTFGLILTELVTNAVKYAFPGGGPGTVTVSLKNGGATALLEVRDDGIGLKAGFDPEQGGGTGLTLVRGLCEQIDGRFRMEGGAAGTRCAVEFAR